VRVDEETLKALMLRSLDGDAQAYRTLLAIVADQLRRYFMLRLGGGAEGVEDLVVETLSAAHKRRATYHRRDAFTPWIYAMARYKLVQHRRGAGIRLPVEDYASFMGAASV
jgi:DNA-directed RNA polymerase specialized sigma24 family protein